ncbi:transposase [Legionella fallonii LLAP-10]|uniref:Transposase n=1 Tax=Legionella fallonii LLAP-10 TaxID=1212491 RepID=A0A098G361_9GAMM|nr:transposase [Legionella fallonii LLAP-10]
MHGQPSIALELYFRMILLGYLYSIKSTRKLIEEIRYNIAYRWFCRLTTRDKPRMDEKARARLKALAAQYLA